ncbi:MAG: hypothetical protein ABIF04_07780 [Chloroflexota bacterium]
MCTIHKLCFLFLSMALVVLLYSCGPPQSTTGTVEEVSLCSLSDSYINKSVSVEGTFTLVSAEADGTFARLEAGGCQVGVWVKQDTLNKWSANDQALIRTGRDVTVEGVLRSNQGELIVELTQPPTALLAEADTPVEVAEAPSSESPCDLTTDRVGSVVRVNGKITIVDTDSEGTFADLEEQGCHVGLWVSLQDWNGWTAEQQALFQVGQRIDVTGTLESFEGSLIVNVSIPPQEVEGQAISSAQTAPDLPSAPDSARLDVPVIYSGLDDLPSLCYLGAFAMLVAHEHPQLDFADVVAFGGVGSNALYLDYPNMPPTLMHRYAEASIINVVQNMGASYVLGFGTGGSGSDPNLPAGMDFETYAGGLINFESGETALDYLERAVASDHPVEVHLNMYYVFNDFAAISDYWRNVLGKDNASHFMTVTGYDTDSIYLNDPTDPTVQAANLSASIENFMQAWEKTQEIPGAPPVGPYWMLFLDQPGDIPQAEETVTWNMDTAQDAPLEIRKFAEDPGDSEFTRFMLHEMSKARTEFADYLERNGWPEAADCYRRSGQLLSESARQPNIDPATIEQIATQEEEALALLGASGQ